MVFLPKIEPTLHRISRVLSLDGEKEPPTLFYLSPTPLKFRFDEAWQCQIKCDKVRQHLIDVISVLFVDLIFYFVCSDI